MQRILIVGGDGLIGRNLAGVLQQSAPDAQIVRTTRRVPLPPGRLELDLAVDRFQQIAELDWDCAFLCASVTSMALCEDDPVGTARVNVDNTLELAYRLHSRGTRLVYLSSNTVFDGKAPYPAEDESYSSVCEYGRQKAVAERLLLALGARVIVVRLSKVIALKAGIGRQFAQGISSGARIAAFRDLRLAPVSVGHVCRSLATISRQREEGIFHVSGREEMSYLDLALAMATAYGGRLENIHGVDSRDSGVRVVFSPIHPALGMASTEARVGIGLQETATLLNDLRDFTETE